MIEEQKDDSGSVSLPFGKQTVVGSTVIAFVSGVIFCLLFFPLMPIQNSRVIKGNDISDINKYVENINAGGCGYFAMKLYERLDSSKYSIVVINDGNHIAILENNTGYFIDANGYRDSLSFQLRYPNKFDKISYDSLKIMVSNIKNWNKTFDRKDTTVINKFVEQL